MIFLDNYQHRKLSANNLMIFLDNYQHRKLSANNLMIFSIIINIANYLQITTDNYRYCINSLIIDLFYVIKSDNYR